MSTGPSGSDAPVPVVKVGLKRVNLEERIRTDPALEGAAVVRALGESLPTLLAQAQGRRFPAQARVFVEGDAGDSLFLLLKGEVRLSTLSGKEVLDVAHVMRGEVLGEREAMGQATLRSATATTLGDIEVIEVSAEVVQSLFPTAPAFLEHLKEVAEKRSAAALEMADFLNRW